MKILDKPMKKTELLNAENVFDGGMIKGVVDVRRELVGIDAEMHADIEQLFLRNGSEQDDLWGINFYPEDSEEDFVEFDSMINVRPRSGNRSRGVENPETRVKIIEIVKKWFS